jgi:FtsH-binding integral membrane protein
MQREGIAADDKLYIYGAMQLYLDFINLFIRILQIFGKRRN